MRHLPTQSKVFVFIYSHSKVRDRKLLARAEALHVKWNVVNIEKQPLTSTHFSGMANEMGIDVCELLDPRIVDCHQITTNEGALTLINKKPELLKTPIVVTPSSVKYIDDFGDLEKLEITADLN